MTRKVIYHYVDGPHGEEVTITFGGMRKNIKASDTGLFEDILRAAENDDADKLVELLDKAVRIKRSSGGLFEVRGTVVFIDNEPAPEAISNKIIRFMEKELSYRPLIEFWRKLKNNPSFNSRTQLFRFLEANKVPIVDDVIGAVDFSGFFVAWKSVTSTFLDHHTKTIDNSPGRFVQMDRREVDDNPSNTCSHGLHVAGWDYAWGFGENSKFVKVYIDPADVVSVPNDYNGQKMRVCKYYVVEEVKREDVKEALSRDVVGSNSDDYDDDDYEEDEDICDEDDDDNEDDIFNSY